MFIRFVVTLEHKIQYNLEVTPYHCNATKFMLFFCLCKS